MPLAESARALVATWRGRFILAFVTVQMLLPVQYYACRTDKHDERFAWRMFSPMRMTTCTPSLQIGGQPAMLGQEFHEAWLELVKRGRSSVIEAMGKRLCERHPGTAIELSVTCSYLGQPEPRTFGDGDICAKARQ